LRHLFRQSHAGKLVQNGKLKSEFRFVSRWKSWEFEPMDEPIKKKRRWLSYGVMSVVGLLLAILAALYLLYAEKAKAARKNPAPAVTNSPAN